MFLTFASLLTFSNANAQLKLGFVDSDVILKQLPEAKAIETEMESVQKLYLDTVQTKENALKSKAETFKSKYEDAQNKVKSGAVTSESEIKALEDEMGGLQKELQDMSEELDAYKTRVQNTLLMKQAELFKPVKDKITKTIEDVAKSMKISFVFDKADGSLLFGDKEFDITFKVLDKLK
jgi:outer membrane protein